MDINEYSDIPKEFMLNNNEVSRKEDALSLIDNENEPEKIEHSSNESTASIDEQIESAPVQYDSKKLNKSLKLLPNLILYMLLIKDKENHL